MELNSNDTLVPVELSVFHAIGSPLHLSQLPETYEVSIRPIDQLVCEDFPIRACVFDCFVRHPDSVVVDAIPESAVNVASISEGEYDTLRHLLWIPEIRRFVIWNGLDNSVRVFGPKVTWSQIIASPFRYLASGPDGELHLRSVSDVDTVNALIRPRADRKTIRMLRGLQRMRLRDRMIMVLMAPMLFALGFMLLTSELPAISKESYEEIRLGTSKREVMRIMRASPGWYQYDAVGYGRFPPFETVSEGTTSGSQRYVWSSADGWLEIYFDQDGKVEHKSFNYSPVFEPSRPERWPWWKRCLNRQIPDPYPPPFNFSPF